MLCYFMLYYIVEYLFYSCDPVKFLLASSGHHKKLFFHLSKTPPSCSLTHTMNWDLNNNSKKNYY